MQEAKAPRRQVAVVPQPPNEVSRLPRDPPEDGALSDLHDRTPAWGIARTQGKGEGGSEGGEEEGSGLLHGSMLKGYVHKMMEDIARYGKYD